MPDEKPEPKEEITQEVITRHKGAEVTELIIEQGDMARQVGIVEIGYRDKFLTIDFNRKPYEPKSTPMDGHTAERHKALNTPPGTPPPPNKEAPTPDG